MRYWTKVVEIADGYRKVRGWSHGFNRVKKYELTIQFDTDQERERFIADYLTADQSEPEGLS